MAMSEKEKKQLIMLGAMVAVGLGILGYVFRDNLLPQATGGLDVAPPGARIVLPNFKGSEELFERRDFKELQRFGDVPVRPTETPPKNPFSP